MPPVDDMIYGRRRGGGRVGITIKDVARAAGTSVSTVSKVINGHYSISEETRKRVRRVIDELGYYPSVNAQNFARGSTRSVVFLTSLAPNTAFENPHMFEIMSGLEAALRRRGYSLVVRGSDMTAASGMAEEIISRRSADGLVIHASVLSRPLAAMLTRSRFPHIVLGLPNFESQVCWIDINNVFSGVTAATHLMKQGYRRIAFIGGLEYDRISAHRLEGARRALEDAGHQLEERYIWLGESSWQEGNRMAKQLLALRPMPDAIIRANNYIALGCVSAIRELGLRIPKDVGVIAFDDYPFSRMAEPELTVVNIDVRDMGEQAGKLLTEMIRNPNMQIQTYTTTSDLIARESTDRKRT